MRNPHAIRKMPLLLCAFVVIVSTATAETKRTLTDTRGRKVEAVLLSADATSVKIRRVSDGKEFSLPLASLSEADLAFIGKWRLNPDAANTPRVPVAAVTTKFVPVVPPHGRPPVKRVFKRISGSEITGMLVDFDGTNVVLRDVNFAQRKIPIEEFALDDRIFVRHWRHDMPAKPSLLREFTRKGETWEARVVEAGEGTVSLVDATGEEYQENLPLAEFDEDDRKFIEAWREGRWIGRGVTWTVEPRFDEISPTKQGGMFRARVGALYGLVDSVGEIVLEPQFAELAPFDSNGLARARNENGVGLIDKSGAVILEPAFDSIGAFADDGLAIVEKGGLRGLIDTGGKTIVAPEWQAVDRPANGFHAVRRDGQWGYINLSGKLVIPCDWDSAGSFDAQGYARVRRGGRTGCIDKTGRVVLRPEWDSIYSFGEDGTIEARVGESYFKVNTAGERLGAWNPPPPTPRKASIRPTPSKVAKVPEGFPEIGRRYDRVARRSYVGLKIGWKWIVEAKWESGFESEGFYFFQNRGGPGILVDATGRVIFEAERGFHPSHRGISEGGFHDGLAMVLKRRPDDSGDLYGFVDRSGTLVIPYEEGHPYRFREGFAADSKGNPKRWGFFDRTGKVVIPYEWEEVRSFREGRARVKRGGKRGYIDRTGKLVSEPQWDGGGNFQEGLARVKRGDKWGYIDREGDLVIDFQWDDAKEFNGGVAFVKRGDKWGLIDTRGQLRGRTEWVRVGEFSRGLAAVNPKDYDRNVYTSRLVGWKFIDPSGKVVISSTGDRRLLYNPPKFTEPFLTGRTSLHHRSTSLIDRRGAVIPLNDSRFRTGQNLRSYYIDPVLQGGLYLSSAVLRGEDYTPHPTRGRDLANVVAADGSVLLPGVSPRTDFNTATAIPAVSPRKRGLMDAAGEILVEPVWDDVRIISVDRVLFRSGGKWGLADRSGKVIVEPSWDEVGGNYFYYWTSTSAIVRNGGKYGLVYTDSGFVIDPVADKRIRPWRQRIFRKDGKFGLKDLDVGLVVRPTMDAVPELWRGLPFEDGGKLGMIDRTGAVGLEPEWDKVEKLSKHWYRFENRNADGETALVVDRDGRAAVPASIPGARYVDFFGERRVVLRSADAQGETAWSIHEPATGKVVAFPDAGAVYWNGSCAEHDLIWVQLKSDESWQLYSAGDARKLGHGLPAKPEKWVIRNGCGKVHDGKDWYFIDPGGKRIEAAEEVKAAPHFSKEPIPAELAEKFDRIAWIAPGVAAVWGDESGLVDRSGEWIFREAGGIFIPRFREFEKKRTAARFQQGLVVIENAPKWGFARLER